MFFGLKKESKAKEAQPKIVSEILTGIKPKYNSFSTKATSEMAAPIKSINGTINNSFKRLIL